MGKFSVAAIHAADNKDLCSHFNKLGEPLAICITAVVKTAEFLPTKLLILL